MDFAAKSPKDWERLYSGGFVGAFKERQQDRKFDRIFSTVASNSDDWKGKVVKLFDYVLKYDDDAYKTSQKTGDCVSHATRNAVDATRAAEIAAGESEGFYVKSATEAIYGSRGHSGQGMSCSRAAKFVTTDGGILLRKNYPDLNLDLSSYKGSYKIGMKWGRSGVPEAVKAEAKKHQVKTATRVTSLEQACSLIANGYAISACSGVGFSSKRDKNGISRAQGSWNHAMMWVAFDALEATFREFGGPLILIQNSWGKFNSGPKRHNQPDGSFWVIPRDAKRILKANGAYAFSNVNGFPPQRLPNWGSGN